MSSLSFSLSASCFLLLLSYSPNHTSFYHLHIFCCFIFFSQLSVLYFLIFSSYLSVISSSNKISLRLPFSSPFWSQSPPRSWVQLMRASVIVACVVGLYYVYLKHAAKSKRVTQCTYSAYAWLTPDFSHRIQQNALCILLSLHMPEE
jgi:hypothetical protein